MNLASMSLLGLHFLCENLLLNPVNLFFNGNHGSEKFGSVG